MLTKLRDWLDHRTGYRRLVDALLIEHIPGGAKWRYVWGSTLLFVFVLQLVTGLLLMTAYSPGDGAAWGSVYYIQYEMDFGWLIRGLHHFGSGTMVVLLGLHMLQVVIAGAHLPPREINWWLGLALLGCVLGMSLTGYLLPWDQKGYWATQVATNIAGNLPVLGPLVQKVVVGGTTYGHHTLTRFFALHVAVLPPLIIVLIIAHLAVFRRHGVTTATPKNEAKDGWFWPDQAFRDLLVSLAIFAVLLTLVIWGHGHPVATPNAGASTGLYESLAHAGRDGRGANLDAPADAARPYPARPEWYFLFLFQLLKYFEGEQEIIGTVLIPMGVGALLFLLPLFGHGWLRKFGHVFGILVVVGLLLSAGVLTYLAMAADRDSQAFQDQEKAAAKLAARAVQAAREGIPAEGAVYLLRRDPVTKGPELFQQYCAGCHSYGGLTKGKDFKAADLADFGRREWIRDLLRDPGKPQYFGRTNLKQMTEWVRKELANPTPDEQKELDLISEWLALHPTDDPAKADPQALLAKGYEAFSNRCLECHSYQPKDKEREGGSHPRKGPDFTGYGSADWLRLMLMAPEHPLRYGRGNRNAMPAFRDLEGVTAELTRLERQRLRETLLKGVAEDDPAKETKSKLIEEATHVLHLSDIDREIILRWLTGDDRIVFGGEPVTGVRR